MYMDDWGLIWPMNINGCVKISYHQFISCMQNKLDACQPLMSREYRIYSW